MDAINHTFSKKQIHILLLNSDEPGIPGKIFVQHPLLPARDYCAILLQ